MTSTGPLATGLSPTARSPRSPARALLTGTGPLVRLALRRDRLMLPWWVVAAVGLAGSTAVAFTGLYPDAVGRLQFTATIELNPTFRAIAGRIYDGSSVGGLTAWRVTTLCVVILGLAGIFVVGRHTRQEEESGRLELLGSTVMGRRAPLLAGTLVAVAADVVAGVLVATVVSAAGADLASSVALGAALAAAGIVFAAVAAVCTQIFESARAANGAAIAVIGAAFLLRALGDSDDDVAWLSWLSPIGWAQQVRPFGGDRWWVVAAMMVPAGVLFAIAGWLNERRDLGAGLVAARRGRPAALPSFAGAGALAWRLQRAPLIGWLIAFVILSGAYGSATKGLASLIESAPQFAEIFRQLGGQAALTDAFLSAIMSMMALTAAAYGISAALRLRSEETAGRVELVLATDLGRLRLLAGHLVIALLGTAALLLVAGTMVGLVTDLVGGSSGHVGSMLRAALALLSAVWVVIGCVVAVFGWRPMWSAAVWGVFAAWAMLNLIGPSLQLPQWALDLSPFTHAVVTGAGFPLGPVLGLVAVAATLIGIGALGFRRRDIG